MDVASEAEPSTTTTDHTPPTVDDSEQIPDTQTDGHSSEGDRTTPTEATPTPTEDEPMAEDTMVVEVQPLSTDQADHLVLSAEVVADTTSDEAIEPIEEASLVSSQAGNGNEVDGTADGNGAEVEGVVEEEEGEEMVEEEEVREEEEEGEITASQSEAEEEEEAMASETREEPQGERKVCKIICTKFTTNTKSILLLIHMLPCTYYIISSTCTLCIYRSYTKVHVYKIIYKACYLLRSAITCIAILVY